MFTGATKIVKPEGQEADEFEQTVAQELFNLEVSVVFSVREVAIWDCGRYAGGRDENLRVGLGAAHEKSNVSFSIGDILFYKPSRLFFYFQFL